MGTSDIERLDAAMRHIAAFTPENQEIVRRLSREARGLFERMVVEIENRAMSVGDHDGRLIINNGEMGFTVPMGPELTVLVRVKVGRASKSPYVSLLASHWPKSEVALQTIARDLRITFSPPSNFGDTQRWPNGKYRCIYHGTVTRDWNKRNALEKLHWDNDAIADELARWRSLIAPAVREKSKNDPSGGNTSTDDGSRYPRQQGSEKRWQVERVAVDFVAKFYQSRGFQVTSHEKDNVGWDLLAVRGKAERRLEVKGLQQTGVCVELTPNEYDFMCRGDASYRLCVVTSALRSPILTVFCYDRDTAVLFDESNPDLTLAIDPIVAARCREKKPR